MYTLFAKKNEVYREKFFKVDYGDYSEFVLFRAKREKGFEDVAQNDCLKNKCSTKFEIDRVEKSRASHMITSLSLCNPFEYFFTQTLNSDFDRYNLDEFKSNIQKLFKAYKRKNPNFIYLIIYEKHKDGAYHLHGLVGGLGSDVYLNSNGYFSLSFFEVLGFNSLSKIIDKVKISHYITKYITKDNIKTSTRLYLFPF